MTTARLLLVLLLLTGAGLAGCDDDNAGSDQTQDTADVTDVDRCAELYDTDDSDEDSGASDINEEPDQDDPEETIGDSEENVSDGDSTADDTDVDGQPDDKGDAEVEEDTLADADNDGDPVDMEEVGDGAVDGTDIVDGGLDCAQFSETAQVCDGENCATIAFVPVFEDVLTGDAAAKVISAVYTEADGGRWYIVSQNGIVTTIGSDGVATEALDIRDRVRTRNGEEGLLGIAFPPDFPENNEVYLSYTANRESGSGGRSLLTKMPVVTSDWTFDKDCESEPIVDVRQPAGNHNAGTPIFGPDGFLYLSLGDGGGANDEFDNGQDINTLLGTIIRIDPLAETFAEGKAYAIPDDNPFVGEDGLDEIFAYGLRNVWKYSFDADDGRLFAADVGQNRFEEIDIIASGGNYGWPLKEAFSCFDADSPCEASELGVIDPIFDYGRSDGRSVTGGYVYRGTDIAQLVGKYVFADFTNGQVWALTDQNDGSWDGPVLTNTPFSVSSFAEGPGGELFLIDYRFDSGPVMHQIAPVPAECAD